MRLPIAKTIFAIALGLVSFEARSQSVVVANPLEWAALAEGNEAIHGQVKKETENQLSTAALQNTIAA